MKNANLEMAGMRAFKKWRKIGWIDNDDLEYLMIFYKSNRAGILSNEDFTDIKELYLLKHEATFEFNEFHTILELYFRKIKGLILNCDNEPDEILPEFDMIKLYKLKLQDRICLTEFSKKKKEIFELRKAGFNYCVLQELGEFTEQVEKGNLSYDDYNNIMELYKSKHSGYIFKEELEAIIELYKQKMRGTITDQVIISGENIPKYDFVRLYKLKLQGRISDDEFENFEHRFMEHRGCIIDHKKGFINDDEFHKQFDDSEDLDLLFYLIENRNKNEKRVVMQYKYEIKKHFDGSNVHCIVFHEEYLTSVFIRDLFIALKNIKPNVIGVDEELSDYTAGTVDSYLLACGAQLKDYLGYLKYNDGFDDFSLHIKTNIGQFELKQGNTENCLYLTSDQDCIEKINYLLSNDNYFFEIK